MPTILEQLNGLDQKKKTREGFRIQERVGVEVAYARRLRGFTMQLRRRTIKAIKETRPRNSGVIIDTRADDFAVTFRNLRAFYERETEQAGDIVRAFAREADDKNKAAFNAGLKKAYGIDVGGVIGDEGLGDVIGAAIESNVGLITNLPESYLSAVEQAVYRNIAGGGNQVSLQKQLTKIGGNLTGRTKLIARDQNSKLNGALNRVRQTNLGVKSYIWVTARDGTRVRPTHRVKDGKTFKWSNPPEDTGHPGDDIQCRCIAQPILDL